MRTFYADFNNKRDTDVVRVFCDRDMPDVGSKVRLLDMFEGFTAKGRVASHTGPFSFAVRYKHSTLKWPRREAST